MFTRAQRVLLQITALLCAGFMLGLVVRSPSMNPLLDRHADRVESTAQSAERPGSQSRSEPARSVGDEPERWLERRQAGDENPLPARRPSFEEVPSELAVVTVFNGGTAREYVVPKE